MRGEIIGVWSVTWREIWAKLAKHSSAPPDLFCELYRELALALVNPLSVETLADIIDSPEDARRAFRKTKDNDLKGEMAVVEFLERAHEVLVDIASDSLVNRYYNLFEEFLEKYSLRYDLRRPFRLNPTLPGVFTRLFRELKDASLRDAHLQGLMHEFEESVRDLRQGPATGQIKSCLQKQFNLLEAFGQKCPGVTATTLGEICGQAPYWPHPTIKEALKKLYGFRSDYPGLGHAGNPNGVLREIEMRDLVAVTVVLAGFSPYLTDQINSDNIYLGVQE